MKKKNIVNLLKKRGFSNFASNYYGGKLYNELFGKNKDKYSLKEKIWAYKRGFTAEAVKVLEINEQNYRDFISYRDYLRLDPLDFFTKRLVDGKLVIPYTIGGRFPQYLPNYYCYINEYGEIIPMEGNIIDTYSGIEDYLNKLLDIVGCVAVKRFTGCEGIGFYKVEKIDNKFFVNNDPVDDLKQLSKEISNKYLITEWIKQCAELEEFWPNSVATLRVVAVNDKGTPHVFVSYIRFGTKASKGASNLSAGGIGLPFNWEDGTYYDEAYRYVDFCENGKYKLDRHPDTGIIFKGKCLPHFDEVKKLVEDICGFLVVHTYFGFDIMIQDNGVKICEINSQPAMNYEQLMFGGLWKNKDPYVVDYFRKRVKKLKNNNLED